MKLLAEHAGNKRKGLLNRLISYKYHLLCWTIFMCYEAFTVGIVNNHFAPVASYLIYYVINISFFYIHASLVLEQAMQGPPKSKYWKVPVFIILEVMVYCLFMICVRLFLSRYTNIVGDKPLDITFPFMVGTVFRSFYFIGFSSGYFFINHFNKERKKTLMLEKIRMENLIQLTRSENAYLKAQINPHFLFNTLDFIYQHAKENSPVAAETIISLSGMMRYAVDSRQMGDYVLLGGEIDQVENLINLHQLRENHQLHIRFWYDDEIRSYKIIPLVLISLVENIFKHGNLHENISPAEVSISRAGSGLLIETKNLVSEIRNSTGLRSGMGNISKRLEYAYGPKSTFGYGVDQDNYFKVRLMIY